ncbi:HTH_48 domain-containing protein [Trichonephila clavipes]|nr:HTH_48 domain-containing protein [Trichonephila clavipes]
MARVLQVHPGNDGLVRVATVKTQDSVTVLSTGTCARRTDNQWCLLRGCVKRLKRREYRVRAEIPPNWKQHHDNAPFHTCFVVTEHLTKNGIVTIPQPLYSPTLPQQTLYSFPKVKTALKGRHHGNLDNLKKA